MRSSLLVLLAAVLCPAAASAYSINLTNGSSGNIIRWNDFSVEYYVHPSGSADIVDGSDIGAVVAGFDAWSGVPCSAIQFNYVSPNQDPSWYSQSDSWYWSNMGIGGNPNGHNEIVWAEGGEWELGSGVLAVTVTSFSFDGVISEADIAFNGLYYQWGINVVFQKQDVLSVALHEEGHFFGGQHVLAGYNKSDPPTMITTPGPNLTSQTLHPDDEDLICFLYPQSEYMCQSNSDCPVVIDVVGGIEKTLGQLPCENNLCGGQSTAPPQFDLGESCSSTGDCKAGLICQPSDQGAICTNECNTDADCSTGYACFPYSNAPGGVCMPWSGGGGTTNPTKNNGEQCQSPQECKSGLCVGPFGGTAYCREPCDLNAPACGAGEECAPLQGVGYGACLPGSGGGANKAPGEPCDASSECITGLCVGSGASYFCREACNTSLGNCPGGYDCVPLEGGGGACIPGAGGGSGLELGQTCEGDADCKSNFCLGIQDSPLPFHCSTSCTSNSGCPCGMECTPFVSGESFCVLGDKLGCVPSGNPCAGASECASGACIDGVCKEPCQLGKAACPSGQACLRINAGSANGFCAPAGATPAGQGCSADAACLTLLCESGVCETPCEPNVSFCGSDQVCQSGLANVPICAPAPDQPTTGSDGVGTGGDGTATGGDGGDGTGSGISLDGSGTMGGTGTAGGTGDPTASGGGRSAGGCSAGAGQPGGLVALALMGLLLLGLRRRRLA